ncbi:DUF5615 family PIN-like protein [Candidatus Palauibacter sp.]|uniref:DUF5615 family PIN-like protein n=1 Tax=Candidatus Palauibacter sp. TaxID=3101350 RepID=UPI003AF25C61
MRILFDQGTPAPLRRHLPDHDVETAFERGWAELRNSALLQQAEEHGYDLLITTDQDLQYQQDLSGQDLAVLVLLSTAWPRIRLQVHEIRAAVSQMCPGDYREVRI